MANNVTIEGLEEVVESLESRLSDAEMKKALKKACLVVERSAKQKAPKGDSGNLRDSISSKVVDDSTGLYGLVYTPLEYAPYVEYGTGLFAEKGGRKDVPWVYVEGSTSDKKSTKSYTDEEADAAVAYLRSKGLKAFKTSGQQPEPFLRPALDENREEIKRILKEGVIKKDD